MPIQTTIVESDLAAMLTEYDLGDYRGYETFANGAGQTTVLVKTTRVKAVLRFYENRTARHVDFEMQLLAHLGDRQFPVPALIGNRQGEYLSSYRGKPYMLIAFVDGAHAPNPNEQFDPAHAVSAVQAVARMHQLTQGYRPLYFDNREAFDSVYCWRQFQRRHADLVETDHGRWFKSELDSLVFPAAMPRGLCHADLNFGNFLFRKGEVVAVLDFDMSFHGFLIYDIASLIYWWAMPPMQGFRRDAARLIVSAYDKCRPLGEDERARILDALKLIILLGVSWGDRSEIDSERQRFADLNAMAPDFAG